MRSSHTISFCLLTTALCFVCTTLIIPSTSPALVSPLGRRSLKDQNMSPSSLEQVKHRKIKVKEEAGVDSHQPASFSMVYNEDHIYHTDYHGVTTHPNPTPKHNP